MEKFPWNSMEIDVLILHGIPWRIFHGNPWNSMEFHGGFSHGWDVSPAQDYPSTLFRWYLIIHLDGE